MADNTREPSAVLSNKQVSVTNTAQLIEGQRLNLYGYILENNHTADVYIQCFDKTTAAEVTLGSTTANFTMRLPASGGVILDPFRAFRHFRNGLVVAVTATRTGSGSPTTAATCSFHYSMQ